MSSIIRTNLGITITDRQLSSLFYHSGGWAQGVITRHLAQLQSDNPIPRGRPKVSESHTEHKLIQFSVQREAEKKPATMQDVIDFMDEHHTSVDRFWMKRFMERNQAVLSFRKARFLEKERHEMPEDDIERYCEALTICLQKSQQSLSGMQTKRELESRKSRKSQT
jgi:hypothetical protein